jgi:hypothetical protein
MTSFPPQYRYYWWCGCGKTVKGGTERGKTEEEVALKEWKILNA